MKKIWDVDIEALSLSDEEKNGLQVFRNYSRAFENKATEKFVEAVNNSTNDLIKLESILKLIGYEDIKFLPVIACSFADEQLEEMFKKEISQTVPGGRASMLSGYGSLSRLSQRIQVAYAFNWMSHDLLEEIDKLRKIRNDISHTWDVDVLNQKLEVLIQERMIKIEEHLADGEKLPEHFWQSLSNESIFRVRLIWLLGRIFYESKLYASAVKMNVNPNVLYGSNPPKLLSFMASKCLEATRDIINRA